MMIHGPSPTPSRADVCRPHLVAQASPGMADALANVPMLLRHADRRRDLARLAIAAPHLRDAIKEPQAWRNAFARALAMPPDCRLDLVQTREQRVNRKQASRIADAGLESATLYVAIGLGTNFLGLGTAGGIAWTKGAATGQYGGVALTTGAR